MKDFYVWMQRTLFVAGVNTELPVQINKRLEVTNVFAITLGTIVAPYIFVFWFLGSRLFGGICILITLFYWFLPLLNKYGFIHFSRVAFVIVAHLVVLLYAIAFGRQSGIYYLFFLTASYAILMFDKSERYKQLMSISLTIICISFFEFYYYLGNPVPILLSDKLYQILNPLLFFTTLLLVGLINYFFYSANNKAEEALEKHNHFVEDLVKERTRDLEKSQQMAHLGNWTWNLTDNLFEFSPELLHIHSIQNNELPKSLLELAGSTTHPEDLGTVLNFLQQVEHCEAMQPLEYRIIHPDSSTHWVMASVPEIISRNANGQPIKIIGTIQDITKQKLVEAELSKLSAAIHQSPVSVVITDRNGIIEYVNPNFCKLTGYEPEEIIGKNPRILKTNAHPRSFYENLWNTILSKEIWKSEIHNRKKNGEEYWEEVVISSIQDSSGHITHFVAVKEDITGKKALWNDLLQAKERAVESDRLKSSFLANMSHEIRTPLNAIVGFSSFFYEDNISPESRKEYVDIIRSNSESLLVLIDDIIDLSRIEAEQIKLNFSDFDALEIIREIIIEQEKGKQSPISLSLVEYPQIHHMMIHSDKVRFRQIVNNLVSNAMKYTEKGNVEIGFHYSQNREVEFFVKDTGIGISHENQAYIFDRFRKIEDSHVRLYRGTGLGLAITKKLVELSGGNIRVESQLGNGSVFYFTQPTALSVPVFISFPQEPFKTVKVNGNERLIAVAEDEKDNYLLLKVLIEKEGIKTLWFSDGKEIVDYFMNSDHCEVDLVLMDLKMPLMDGYEAAEKIRRIFPLLPIVAQTAHAMPGDLEKMERTGFDDVLIKPIKIAKLNSIIQKYVKIPG